MRQKSTSHRIGSELHFTESPLLHALNFIKLCQPVVDDYVFRIQKIQGTRAAAKNIDKQLAQLGATRQGERLEIDVSQDPVPEDPAEKWLEDWEKQLDR